MGETFSMALTSTSTGFLPVFKWIILKAVRTLLMILLFSPPLDPGFMRLLMKRSTMLSLLFLNLRASCLPPLWGSHTGSRFR